MYLLGFIIILTYLLFKFKYLVKNNTLKEIKEKINEAYHENYKISLSLSPVFNSHHDDYKKFFDMIDYIHIKEKNIDMYSKSKISIKIRQLGSNKLDQFNNLLSIMKYSNSRGIFVWIATVLRSDLDEEYDIYNKLRMAGFENLGLTLSTYNYEVSDKVDQILDNHGHIRLVKGYYKGNVKNWNKTSELFLKNAIKLAKSKNYHCLATHDFEIIKKINQYKNSFIEYAFFFNSRKYVYYSINRYNLQLNRKSFYIYYGDVIPYFRDNYKYLDYSNIFKRMVRALMY